MRAITSLKAAGSAVASGRMIGERITPRPLGVPDFKTKGLRRLKLSLAHPEPSRYWLSPPIAGPLAPLRQIGSPMQTGLGNASGCCRLSRLLSLNAAPAFTPT